MSGRKGRSESYANMIMLVVEDLGKEILAVGEGMLVVTSCMTVVRGVQGPTRTLSITTKWHARHEKGWLPFDQKSFHLVGACLPALAETRGA